MVNIVFLLAFVRDIVFNLVNFDIIKVLDPDSILFQEPSLELSQ